MDSRYACHCNSLVYSKSTSNIKPLLLSLSFISFSVNHLKPPVGRYWDIAQPYRLLASRYVITCEVMSRHYSRFTMQRLMEVADD